MSVSTGPGRISTTRTPEGGQLDPEQSLDGRDGRLRGSVGGIEGDRGEDGRGRACADHRGPVEPQDGDGAHGHRTRPSTLVSNTLASRRGDCAPPAGSRSRPGVVHQHPQVVGELERGWIVHVDRATESVRRAGPLGRQTDAVGRVPHGGDGVEPPVGEFDSDGPAYAPAGPGDQCAPSDVHRQFTPVGCPREWPGRGPIGGASSTMRIVPSSRRVRTGVVGHLPDVAVGTANAPVVLPIGHAGRPDDAARGPLGLRQYPQTSSGERTSWASRSRRSVAPSAVHRPKTIPPAWKADLVVGLLARSSPGARRRARPGPGPVTPG